MVISTKNYNSLSPPPLTSSRSMTRSRDVAVNERSPQKIN